MLTGRMKEWEDLSQYERRDIVEILARLVLDVYLHAAPFFGISDPTGLHSST